ncbi:MAG: low molecular weight phosphotyrosine protein phosphatase [Prosthecobacter sp.]|jgi:protein-tyrosine phosphatase|uniref:low molecular weight protein-tyrosine-phosphatase n=1 Tax=Prosthecobacter sp. TaxID=1965333 RepID=UPI001A071B1D|nr:low molecular weight protein-tyrosine-phosphatase [Prosthecobacter sp.]MBE2282022.1 low molecular weight phosphotyrosine protein phosphatase [Prosthecobacter sp.]
MDAPYRLLFVCMGNICRSPAAEGVMRALVESSGFGGHIAIRSAGTGGWHAGKLPDQRMRNAAQKRGYNLQSRARQVTAEDLRDHDLILVMDRDNHREIRPFDRTEGGSAAKIRLFCEFCTGHDAQEVPDPYYGGEQGFEHVLDLLEDGCRGVLQHICEQRGL